MPNCLKKSLAFTLAETLIVMGIIGVVSALTLPNLNSSTGEKEKIAKVKKIYQNLNDALERAQVVYGPFDEWTKNDSSGTAGANRIGERMTEFMKVSKNCKTTTNAGCFPKTTSSSDINDTRADSYTGYRFITADGQSVIIMYDGGSTNLFMVDINGPNKGSHKFGKDIFVFTLNTATYESKMQGITPMRPSAFSSYFNGIQSGAYSLGSGWVIDYDNMDYLDADNTGKCKNGTVMNETNPRCK